MFVSTNAHPCGYIRPSKRGVMRAVDINRLVVIDDDVEDISLLHDVLMDLCATAECESFSDPCIAIEKLRSRTGDLPQLVIIDFHMLTLNGLECLKQFKEVGHFKETRLVVLSAMDLPGRHSPSDSVARGNTHQEAKFFGRPCNES